MTKSFFNVFVVVAVLTLACDRHPTPVQPTATPAAKTTEAWGFDFRIDLEPGLTDKMPLGTLSIIRKAAQAWERVIWNSADIEHIVNLEDMSPVLLPLTSAWQQPIEDPSTYLGWTDIEILVFIDESIQTADNEAEQLLTAGHIFAAQTDTTAWDGRYMPVIGLKISPYAAREARSGTLDLDVFYQDVLSSLGTVLGFNIFAFERHNLVNKTDDACSYIGTNGLRGLSFMRERVGNQIYKDAPLVPSCNFWDKDHIRWDQFVRHHVLRFVWLEGTQ